MGKREIKRRFYVRHLESLDRPAPDLRFEIQVLNPKGQAAACGYTSGESFSLEVERIVIPAAVIEAATRQPLGVGDYVDDTGSSIPPF